MAEMEYMEEEGPVAGGTAGKILCCQCGTPIEPNPANMCVGCLRTQVDITEDIAKQGHLYFCKFCERYLQPPSAWVSCVLESRELLSLCLKKLKGLSKVHLVDAGFVWTEPHSKRIKVKLTVQKEVFGGAILQQTVVVEFIVNGQMCDDCRRREAKDFWRAVVQVRQKAAHKKTFLYLEQLILKHKAHTNSLNIKGQQDGIDFFYASKSGARKLVDFLLSVVPCKYKTSQELIGHDPHSNTYNYKYSFSVEIVPVCKNDIVCLSPKLSQQLGNFGPLAVCQRVTSSVQLVDPHTLRVVEISSSVYWRHPFKAVCSPRQLTEYFVLQTEPVVSKAKGSGVPGCGAADGAKDRFQLMDLWVTRSKDVGIVDQQTHVRTHLGHLLNPGDTAMGFDFTCANINEDNFEKLKRVDIPDVILVKKSFGERRKRKQHRNWKLRKLLHDGEGSVGSVDGDVDDFMDDLEEDQALRQNVNIYFNPSRRPPSLELEALDAPRIGIEEMLEEMTLHHHQGEGEGMD